LCAKNNRRHDTTCVSPPQNPEPDSGFLTPAIFHTLPSFGTRTSDNGGRPQSVLHCRFQIL
jgi:hypothetical protein